MKKYDFDRVIDRHDTLATKYEKLDFYFGRHDITPLWIADLDFAVCPDITEALLKRIDTPVLGYSVAPDSYWQAIIDWQKKRHGFEIDREEICFVPGVVKGIGLAVNYFTNRGDKIVIQPPVYHPFRMVIEGNGREVVANPLIFDGVTYRMDLEGLAEIIEREKPKMMILCNPHNPIGIQWDADTLAEVGRLCRKAGVVVVSDEIHGDLMLWGRKHLPFVEVSDDTRAVAVTLGAPSKTFNIPGLVSSWMVVKDPELRAGFFNWLEANEFNAPVLLSAVGAEAAYRNGERWLDEMLEYVQDNLEFVNRYLKENMPEVVAIKPQASFLLWLDFRRLGLDQQQLMDLLLDKAHVALNDGSMFGAEGTGFMRLNVGTPRCVLRDALDHIARAVATAPVNN